MIDNIILDFDSTIINAEGVELIIVHALERESPEKAGALKAQLHEMTLKATNGEIPLGEALRLRFNLTEVLREDVEKAAALIVNSMNPMVAETIEALRRAGKQIYVFSTSFDEIVRPVTDALLIPKDHVFSNQLIYDFTGRVVGINENNPLFFTVGKGFLAEQLKNEGRLPGRTAVVGDGSTDLSLRKNNIAQIFVYYSGAQILQEIRQQADFSIERFNQLLPLFFSEAEYSYKQAETEAPVENEVTVRPRAVLLENIHEKAVACLHDAAVILETHKGVWNEEELITGAQGAHLLGIRSQSRVTARVIESLPELWAVGAFCIGINQIDLDAAARAGIPVFNAPYSNTRSVAELVVGETIMLMRRVMEKNAAAHQGRWLKTAEGCSEVRGKTVGIVGYGHIGSQVSVLFESMGMSVVFHDIVDKLPLGNVRRAQNLHALLEQADVVTLHVPDTPETRGMIGAAELQRMKAGSFLINSSRGKVVELQALYNELKAGRLAGAAIDVFPREPGRADEAFTSPLQGLENVILTPHIGGSTREAQENIALYVGKKLVTYLNTGNTQGAVNFPEVDMPRMAGTHRILHIHKNVPGVLAKINSVFARRNINVAGQMLQTNDHIGYLVVDVDHHISGHVLELMRHITETIKIRKIA